MLALCFASVRTAIATVALINRGARGGEGPLDRLLAQLVHARADASTEAPPIAQLAIDIIELGVGVRADVLLAAEEDWGWTDRDRRRASTTTAAPDPLLVRLARRAPRAAVRRRSRRRCPTDLRELREPLFERHGARALVAGRAAATSCSA